MSIDNNTLSGNDRQHALEIARELHAREDRLSCLVSLLEEHLRPKSEGEDPIDSTSWRLSEVLVDILADAGQHQRLIKILDLKAEAAA